MLKIALSYSYESTSSDDSSSESSDEGSDSSEYHEARERLPDASVQHQHMTPSSTSKAQDESLNVPQQTAVKQPAAIHEPLQSPSQSGDAEARLSDKVPQSPATETVVEKCSSHPSVSDSSPTPPCPAKETASQLSEKHALTQEIASTSSNTEASQGQKSSDACFTKTTEATEQQYTVQSESSATASHSEAKTSAESSSNDTGKASSKQVR